MEPLLELRAEIDSVDRAIKELYQRRLRAVSQVAELKLHSGANVYHPEREAQVLASLSDTYGLPEVYQTIMRRSRELQYQLLCQHQTLPYTFAEPSAITTVYYQGIPGSYSSAAAAMLYPDAPHVSVAAFSDVAQKSATIHPVWEFFPSIIQQKALIDIRIDLLLANDIYIVKSAVVEVRHCLAAPKGASLDTIRTILSHPQAIAQCRSLSEQFLCVPCPILLLLLVPSPTTVIFPLQRSVPWKLLTFTD